MPSWIWAVSLLTNTAVAVLPVTAPVILALRLIVVALSVVVPLTVTVPLTVIASPDSAPVLIFRFVMPWLPLALVILTVSLPAAAVVLTARAEPRTRTFSNPMPPLVPLTTRAGVVLSVSVPSTIVMLLPALGVFSVNEPPATL